jgi:hypothetical protein
VLSANEIRSAHAKEVSERYFPNFLELLDNSPDRAQEPLRFAQVGPGINPTPYHSRATAS